jgi:hypothetical protein
MKRIVLAAMSAACLAAAAGGPVAAQPYYPPQPARPAVPAQPYYPNQYPAERYAGGRPGGGPYEAFDVRGARTWAERLVLCDTAAFLASRPNLDADRMWVRREGRRPDLLLPPYFIGAGRWYKEGYQRLFWQMRRQRLVTDAEVYRAQDNLARRYVDAYRRINPYGGGGSVGSRFLDEQDRYCRRMARDQGGYVD